MRNESGWLDYSQLRMAHANKGFRAAQFERLAPDLGLVPQFESARRMAVRADAARIDATRARGRYSLRLRTSANVGRPAELLA